MAVNPKASNQVIRNSVLVANVMNKLLSRLQ